MSRDRSTCHTNPPDVTDTSDKTAGVTGVTGCSGHEAVTGDRLSPVDPPIRARVSDTQTEKRVTPVTRHHPGQLTEPVEATHCTRCGQPIIRAHSDGILIRADPTPLDLTAELHAHLAHRSTYQFSTHADGHLELTWRNLDLIRGPRTRPVVADHQCPPNSRPLDPRVIRALPPAQRLTTRPAHSTGDTDAPPF